jgi:hypothetical protein
MYTPILAKTVWPVVAAEERLSNGVLVSSANSLGVRSGSQFWGLNPFLNAARQAAAEVIVLDALYSTHDQDENDTRSMAALCHSLFRLRELAGSR